jgi:phosphatidylserine/phosphatidylglycerophosphate/cardiolipin synthase-like enzyme
MAGEFQVMGKNAAAPFTLKVHRGDGMALLAMNWRKGEPPRNFVGFAIEYRKPGSKEFLPLKNRLGFAGKAGKADPNQLSTLMSPIQKFRWVHLPRNAELAGEFEYRVTPRFMNADGLLTSGEFQNAAIELRRETYPGKLNVTFTRGFVSSQAFVDRFLSAGPISKLLPRSAKAGLKFKATHPKAKEALEWMGFEARSAILELLDQAIADKEAKVRVVAYDLSEPEVVTRLKKLGKRLRIIIDDSAEHGESDSSETAAAKILSASAGKANVKRQHMGSLQHNKTIVVDGPKVKAAVCGSTNFSWRGFYVQANNAVVVHGKKAIAPFVAAFEDYFQNETPATFGATASAEWQSLQLSGVDAQVAFSPHSASNALIKMIANDVKKAKSSVLYSLAFLYQTRGPIRDAVTRITEDPGIFVYGISDRKVGGINVQKPNGNVEPVFPANLSKAVPEPFKAEPTGGGGIRMHHKFLVLDFERADARVYLGSYNFSDPADTANGENLLLIRDRRIATAYMVEAIRLLDHYHFRVAQKKATKKSGGLVLARPPRKAGEKPWWAEYYSIAHKIQDRELFA